MTTMTDQLTALPDELRERLEQAVERIVALADPRLIILFGSYAEGRQTSESDVDLLVVAEHESRAEITAKLRTSLRPVLEPLNFDLLVYTPASWESGRHLRGFVTREADRKGVRLYEAA